MSKNHVIITSMKNAEKAEIVKTIINNSKGRFFTVTFKKADGSLRKMTARTGVNKGITGTGHSRSELVKDTYALVWACDAENFRNVNYDTVESFKMGKLDVRFI